MRASGFMTLGAVLCLSAACGSSTSPSGAQFGFNWTGQLQITSCTVSGGESPSECATAPVGGTTSFSLTFTQSGNVVSGPFTIGAIAFPSTGATVTNGTLTIQSAVSAAGETDQAAFSLTVSGNTLSGTAETVVSNTGGAITVFSKVVSATHP